ncbi:hypothetical protein [Streptomyces anulatus]|uniref:hypothetical protein n=1 Tax=Streptomyces anulatus TaxID=1892 RepID=UPI0036917CE8
MSTAPRRNFLDELTAMVEAGGIRPDHARESATEWLEKHSDDFAALTRRRHFIEAADAITKLQDEMDAEIRAEYGGDLDRDTEVESAATRRMASALREHAVPDQPLT